MGQGPSDTAAGEVGKEKITLETYAQMAYFERIIARGKYQVHGHERRSV